MHIKLMWVKDTKRSQGLGTRIIELIEQEAMARECVGIHSDAYSFQAKHFYLKLGFEIFGVIDCHPQGYQRDYLSNKLAQKSS